MIEDRSGAIGIAADRASVTTPFLDPEMEALAQLANAPNAPSILNSPPTLMRAVLSQLSPQGGPAMVSVHDQRVCGVATRDYRPSQHCRGTILFMHGGGWVTGSLDDYDSFTRLIASITHCRVVSVDYRLAPEHPFPAAVVDVHAVFGALDPDGPLLVAGDSAGGNLAAVLCQLDRDKGKPRIAGQILIYPSVAGRTDGTAMHAFEPPMMKRAEIEAYYDLYVPDRELRRDVRFAPALGQLDNLPPALVITAGADLLAAEGEAYVQALLAAGCDAALHRQEGAIHAYLTLLPQSRAAQATMDRIANFVSGLVSSAS
ncbi:alpha/beta hydrolase [Novosphingobium cyanobacteriorum]|uniref:Alpha/beta hydrolase n=1 Tax=Novosphingobium cyanobacteriorum TaxID=3024215 RepID=A0ABT6CIQ9_9SPHN|nr:alpha/beta hydrolase [Novosphingobium cyanobacteriorum]MDF8333809.1 alpha/beta hydrolase [Novosphingobium cyanobacteriorum]